MFENDERAENIIVLWECRRGYVKFNAESDG
jgi:hypothetical protein